MPRLAGTSQGVCAGTKPAEDRITTPLEASSAGVTTSDSAPVGEEVSHATQRQHARSPKEVSNTAPASMGIVLNDVSGSVHELKQALLCQLKGMVLQLECLRKCDAVLSGKCGAQARAASALRTFSQVRSGRLCRDAGVCTVTGGVQPSQVHP